MPELLTERAFYERLRNLFGRALADHGETYDELLYGMRHPFDPEYVRRAAAFRRDGVHKFDAEKAARVLDRALAGLHYPDVAPLAALAHVEGMDFATAVNILHFHQPSYPILDAEVACGLARLGHAARLPRGVDAASWDAYAQYLRISDVYKEGIPYTFVPETHFYLGRLIEGALWALGSEA